jgi:hypothetical protein
MSDITTDFITATKRILAKVATILTHVEVIEGDVKLIREQTVANTDKPRIETQANKLQEENRNSIPSSNPGQAERKKQKGKDEAQNSFQRLPERWWKEIHKPKFQVAVLTLLGLIAYTCETHRANNLTGQTLQNAKDQFRRDQRPYVYLLGNHLVDPPVIVKSGDHQGQMGTAFHFNNYGKSPAIDVRQDGHIAIGDKECSELEGIETPITAEHGSFIPPGESAYFDFAYSTVVPSDEMMRSIVAGDIPVAVFGHFEYTDGLMPKLKYISEFCIMPYARPDKLPAHNYCREHNRITQR